MIRKFIKWLIAPAIAEALQEHKSVHINLQSLCNEVKICTINEDDINQLHKEVEKKISDIIKASNLDLK